MKQELIQEKQGLKEQIYSKPFILSIPTLKLAYRVWKECQNVLASIGCIKAVGYIMMNGKIWVLYAPFNQIRYPGKAH